MIELIEYFVISSDVLYRVTESFAKVPCAKHWAADGQYILHHIRRCKVEKQSLGHTITVGSNSQPGAPLRGETLVCCP